MLHNTTLTHFYFLDDMLQRLLKGELKQYVLVAHGLNEFWLAAPENSFTSTPSKNHVLYKTFSPVPFSVSNEVQNISDAVAVHVLQFWYKLHQVIRFFYHATSVKQLGLSLTTLSPTSVSLC